MLRITLPLLFLLTIASGAQSRNSLIADYVEIVERAQRLTAAQDWGAAADEWARLVSMSPNDAWAWYYLGQARYNNGHYREALEPFSKALELGAGSLNTSPAFDIARVHGRLHDRKAAIEWLQRALDLGFRSRERIRSDEAFRFLKDDAGFLSLAGPFDVSRLSRQEGWRHDLAFLAAEVRRMHTSPFRKTTREQFDAEVRRLHDDIPRLSDNQRIVRIMGLLKKIGDGHTGCFPDMVSAWSATLPVQFQLFPDGLYVIAADSAHADLVGSRVLRVGGRSADQVVRTLDTIISCDNPQGLLRSVPSFLRYPQVLDGLGLVPESGGVTLTVHDRGGGERAVTVRSAPSDPNFDRIMGHPDWVTAYDRSPGPLPLYLKDRRKPFWFEYLPVEKTVYFQFNTVTNTPEETLQAFTDRLFAFIQSNAVDKLVIDMRWNNGGNSRLLPPLINGLIASPKINRRGRLFAIVGRYTYSAAMNATTFLEQQTNAMLVGEPTPSSPNFVGESNIVTLPYSGLRLSISDLFWQSSWPTDKRTWIAPGIDVPPTFDDYRSKRDPALEAILSYQPRE